MCKFYHVPCRTEDCPQKAQRHTMTCGMEPNCQAQYIPLTHFVGTPWCFDCIRDGTWFAWTHLETQIRGREIYPRWIATLRGTQTYHNYSNLFTRLQRLGLQPPALGYVDRQQGVTYYSLPIGLRDQDLNQGEKDRIPTMFMLTEQGLDIMERHRVALTRFHERLEMFLIQMGLGKLPRSEMTV